MHAKMHPTLTLRFHRLKRINFLDQHSRNHHDGKEESLKDFPSLDDQPILLGPGNKKSSFIFEKLGRKSILYPGRMIWEYQNILLTEPK
jgi:hypothetical protein